MEVVKDCGAMKAKNSRNSPKGAAKIVATKKPAKAKKRDLIESLEKRVSELERRVIEIEKVIMPWKGVPEIPQVPNPHNPWGKRPWEPIDGPHDPIDPYMPPTIPPIDPFSPGYPWRDGSDNTRNNPWIVKKRTDGTFYVNTYSDGGTATREVVK